jgi:hypothetical protein
MWGGGGERSGLVLLTALHPSASSLGRGAMQSVPNLHGVQQAHPHVHELALDPPLLPNEGLAFDGVHKLVDPPGLLCAVQSMQGPGNGWVE